MGFVENLRVSKERAQAGLCAEEDRPSAVFGAGIVSRVHVAEDASTKGDELLARFPPNQTHKESFNFCNKHFKGADM